MPSYNDLRPNTDPGRRDYALVFPDMDTEQRKRTITNLLSLRTALSEQIIPKHAGRNLLVGSWNIKEFGHTTQRRPEAYFYMAEVVSRLDLVVVQEIKSGLKDLEILMKLLGDDWGYLVNDITEGTDGNSERSGYLYDKTRVQFAGLAGEIVLWDGLTASSTLKQLKRTPYITGFRAGWKTFRRSPRAACGTKTSSSPATSTSTKTNPKTPPPSSPSTKPASAKSPPSSAKTPTPPAPRSTTDCF
jgi:hypothetical protein